MEHMWGCGIDTMEKSDWNKYRTEIKKVNDIDLGFEPINIGIFIDKKEISSGTVISSEEMKAVSAEALAADLLDSFKEPLAKEIKHLFKSIDPKK